MREEHRVVVLVCYFRTISNCGTYLFNIKAKLIEDKEKGENKSKIDVIIQLSLNIKSLV